MKFVTFTLAIQLVRGVVTVEVPVAATHFRYTQSITALPFTRNALLFTRSVDAFEYQRVDFPAQLVQGVAESPAAPGVRGVSRAGATRLGRSTRQEADLVGFATLARFSVLAGDDTKESGRVVIPSGRRIRLVVDGVSGRVVQTGPVRCLCGWRTISMLFRLGTFLVGRESHLFRSGVSVRRAGGRGDAGVRLV